MRRIAHIALAMAATMPLAGVAADRIVVGQSAPLTGSNAEIGKDIRDGAAAWFKRVNESGGVNGKAIEFVSLDDKNDRKTAGANAVKLVNDSGAVALFGFASATLSLDAMPIVKEKLHFMADYLSGTSDLSVAVVGGVIYLPGKWQLSLGGQIPSPGSDNSYGAVMELTQTDLLGFHAGRW